VSLILGILCRGLVLRITDRQYPKRPQDFLEQIVTSGLAASLGAIALPALIEKEFSALTFFAVAIQQFQGLGEQERITLANIDEEEIVKKGAAYVEEIASTYESRCYISLLSALMASWLFIFSRNRFNFGFLGCTIIASIGAIIVGILLKRYLRRESIGDIAEIKPAKIYFDGPLLKVNDVVVSNIGLSDTRKKYLESGLAIEIVPKTIGDYGIISDLGQRQAIIHNIFIHLGIDKDVDEIDILATSSLDIEKNTVIIPFIPILKDVQTMIQIAKSTPILESAKGKNSDYKKSI
jgi:hypothetical protein